MKNLPRLLLFINRLDTVGGTERVLVNHANFFYEKGHDITIGLFEKNNVHKIYGLNKNIRVSYHHYHPLMIKHLYSMNKKNKLTWLRMIEQMKSDIIIAYGSTSSITLGKLYSHKKSKKPMLIATEHFELPERNYSRRGIFALRLQRILYYRHIDKIITLSTKFNDYFSAAMQSKVATIKNFVLFPPEKKSQRFSKNMSFFYPASLSTPKNQILLIDAFERVQATYPNISLHFYGNINKSITKESKKYLDLLKSKVTKNKIKNIFFHQSEDIKKICSKHDVLVSPSFLIEGCPMIMLEAFTLSVPVIGSDIAAHQDLIIDKKSGRLFKSNDVDDLARVMTESIEHPEDLQKYADEAYRLSFRFQPEVIYQQWLAVFNNRFENAPSMTFIQKNLYLVESIRLTPVAIALGITYFIRYHIIEFYLAQPVLHKPWRAFKKCLLMPATLYKKMNGKK